VFHRYSHPPFESATLWTGIQKHLKITEEPGKTVCRSSLRDVAWHVPIILGSWLCAGDENHLACVSTALEQLVRSGCLNQRNAGGNHRLDLAGRQVIE
jgi:hypothetical protein